MVQESAAQMLKLRKPDFQGDFQGVSRWDCQVSMPLVSSLPISALGVNIWQPGTKTQQSSTFLWICLHRFSGTFTIDFRVLLLQPEPSVGYEPSYIANSHVDRLQSDQLLSVYWSSQQQLKESCWYSFSKLLPKATQRTTCMHQQRQRTRNFVFKARFSLAKSLSILNVAQPQTFEHYLLMLLIMVFMHSIKYYPLFFLFLLI